MKIIHSTDEFHSEAKTAVTIGKFDGVHVGHRELITDILSRREEGLSSLVFTFTNSPRQFIDNTAEQMILSADERRSVIEEMDIDYFAEFIFNEQIRRLSPSEFLNILISDLKMGHLCVGDDFRFGYRGEGDVGFLRERSEALGFSLRVVTKLRHNNEIISSTYIRDLISKGDIATAGELLRRDYRISGEVIHGKKLGRTLGIPTINIEPSPDKLLPKFGVYFTTVEMEGVSYPSITNIGMKPTVTNEGRVIVESHLLDVSGDFYGRHAEIFFHDKLRDEMKFGSIDELQERMHSDIKTARFWFAER